MLKECHAPKEKTYKEDQSIGVIYFPYDLATHKHKRVFPNTFHYIFKPVAGLIEIKTIL